MHFYWVTYTVFDQMSRTVLMYTDAALNFHSAGVISTVLSFVEPALMKICIHDDSYVAGAPPPPKYYGGRRRMLAAGDGYADTCPAGQRQVFSLQVLHETHYLLFAVAAVHVVYSTAAFAASLQRFKLWRAHEDYARDHEVQHAVWPTDLLGLTMRVRRP